MAIAQPDWLFAGDVASGTTFTNYGTKSTPYIIQAGTSPTNFTWNPTAGPSPFIGNWTGITTSNANMPWAKTLETVPNGVLYNMNAMVAFNISGVSGGTNDTVFMTGVSTHGDVFIQANNVSGGNFDLNVRFANAVTQKKQLTTFAAIALNSTHVIACSCDTTTVSNVVCKASLNGAAAVTMTPEVGAPTSGSPDWTGDGWNQFWPTLFNRADYGYYYGGVVGKINAFAYERNSSTTAWTGAELASISNNPVSAFSGHGWPGTATAVPIFTQQGLRRR